MCRRRNDLFDSRCHANANANANANPNADANPNANTDADPNANTDADADANPNADANTDANTDGGHQPLVHLEHMGWRRNVQRDRQEQRSGNQFVEG